MKLWHIERAIWIKERVKASVRFAAVTLLTSSAVVLPDSAHAQGAHDYGTTTFQEDGEWEKSLPGRRNSGGYGKLVAPAMVCKLPTEAELKTRIEALIADGTLNSKLTELENAATPNVTSIRTALNAFMNNYYAQRYLGSAENYSFGAANLTNAWAAGGPYVTRHRENCLPYSQATTWVKELRGVIRAYLGLPAPQ